MGFFSFGNLAIDDLVYANGTTLWASAGGAAMYSALGMAVWTGRATTVAPVGPDYPCAQFPRIDFAGAHRLAHTMRNWGLYEDDGSRHFVPRRDSEDWGAASPEIRDLGAGPYTHCHLGAMPWDRAHALVAALRARGARTISLDIHDRKLTGITLEQYLELVRGVDIFLPSVQDVADYFPGLTAADALRALRAAVPAVAVLGIKRGDAGALVHAAGTTHIMSVPPAPATIVDVTGAGDAFCGGFLTGYAEGNDATAGALRGAVSASFAIAATGTAGLVGVDSAVAHQRLTALRAAVTALPLEA
jgi:sugar/nucleoside kinase (ribokinase family)